MGKEMNNQQVNKEKYIITEKVNGEDSIKENRRPVKTIKKRYMNHIQIISPCEIRR